MELPVVPAARVGSWGAWKGLLVIWERGSGGAPGDNRAQRVPERAQGLFFVHVASRAASLLGVRAF